MKRNSANKFNLAHQGIALGTGVAANLALNKAEEKIEAVKKDPKIGGLSLLAIGLLTGFLGRKSEGAQVVSYAMVAVGGGDASVDVFQSMQGLSRIGPQDELQGLKEQVEFLKRERGENLNKAVFNAQTYTSDNMS